MSTVDAVVVGLGVSGLTALRELERAGLDCVGIDARTRVGGRTERRVTESGLVFEGGAEFVKAGHGRIRDLAAGLGIRLLPLHEHGMSVFVQAGERHVEFTPFDDDGDARASYERAHAALEDIVSTVVVGAAQETPDAPALDATTAAEWAASVCTNPAALGRLRRDLVGGLGGSPETVSLLAIAHYRAAAGGAAGRDERLDGGGAAVAAKLAEGLESPLLLDHAVTRIQTSDSGVTVSGGGFSIEARSVIVALSPKLALSIVFEPALPVAHRSLVDGWQQGFGTKTYLAYERPWWREEGLSGFASGDLYARSVADLGAVDGSGLLLIETHPVVGAAPLDPDAHRAAVLADVEIYFGPAPVPVRDVGVHAWIEDPLAGGCGSPLPVGLLTSAGSALGQSVGPLSFAGTETAGHGWGSLEGAVLAGERSAAEVLARVAALA